MLAARSALAAVIAPAGLLLVPASANACSCISRGGAALARDADVVFTGTVVGQDVSHPFWPTASSGGPHPPDATIRLPERHLATTVWGVGGAALALVAMVASGLAVRARGSVD